MRGVVDDEMAAVEVVKPTRGRSVLDGLEDDGTAQHGHLRREVGFVLDRRGSVGVLEDFGRRRTFDYDLARGHVDAARGQDVVAGPRSPPLGAGHQNLDLTPPLEDGVPASRRLRPDLKTSLEAGLGIVPDRLPPVQVHDAVGSKASEGHVLRDAGREILALEVDGELGRDVVAPTSGGGGLKRPDDGTVGTAQSDF